MNRSNCLECYCKHLAIACVYEEESRLGYPENLWLSIGQIAAAELEVLEKYPELSTTTRDYRIKLMKEGTPFPTLELINLAQDLLKMELLNQKEELTKTDPK